MITVGVGMGTTKSGFSCLRASTADGEVLAYAILLADRWHITAHHITAHLPGPPDGDLIARSEADARAWVRWIGEQIARDWAHHMATSAGAR